MINKVILIGNLGQDPKVRSTQSGQAVTTFSMATSRRWKNAEGEPQEHTEWHNVVCFGRVGEVAGQYLAKGRQVYVEGRLQTRSWEDQVSRTTRFVTEIVCENLQMLGQRPEAEAEAATQGEAEQAEESPEKPEEPSAKAEEEPPSVKVPKPPKRNARRKAAKRKS